MKRAHPAQFSVETLPRARVAVVGKRAHGTSEVIAALRSLGHARGIEPSAPRRIEPAQRGGEIAALINDKGPSVGVALHHALLTAKRHFSLYDCVDSEQSVLLATASRFEAVLWVHSSDRDVEDEPIVSMLDAARFLGARHAMVFVTDAEQMSPAVLDAIEQDVRSLLDRAGFVGDQCPVVFASGSLRDNESNAWKPAIALLREALDDTVPYVDADACFAMRIEGEQVAARRKWSVFGRIATGEVRVGDSLEITDSRGERWPITVAGFAHSPVPRAQREDTVTVTLTITGSQGVDAARERAPSVLLTSSDAGHVGARVRTRAFNWRSGAATHVGRTMRDAPDQRDALDPQAVQESHEPRASYERMFDLPTRRPLLVGESLVLFDDVGPFGVARIVEVLE